MKVKYGQDAEIHTEVAATRLLRAVGAGANEVYYLKRLRCFGCPREPDALLRCASNRSASVRRECEPLYGEVSPSGEFKVTLDYGKYVDFPNVSVERWADGKTIRTDTVDGWGWDELESAQSDGEGASRAERDALRLLAVFLNDWDNSPDNQRLLCLPGGLRDEEGRCALPFAYMDDVGATFGRTGLLDGKSEDKLDVEGWSRVGIWKDAGRCTVSIRSPVLHHATFGEAEITESGRRLLADRLRRLTPRQLRDLFAGAGFADFDGASGASRDIDRWVAVFRQKVHEIADRPPCPSP
jgi:hypothetical protein